MCQNISITKSYLSAGWNYLTIVVFIFPDREFKIKKLCQMHINLLAGWAD